LIEGGGLVQVIVTSISPLVYYLFLNDRHVPQLDIESLSISIEAPDEHERTPTVVRATLALYVDVVSGGRTLQRMELFPCSIEIIAAGRRLSITAMNRDSIDGLWINLGLKPDGTSSDLTGLKSLRFLLTEGIFDAKLTWVEGDTEDVFPQ
jgi:hypothetical protein